MVLRHREIDIHHGIIAHRGQRLRHLRRDQCAYTERQGPYHSVTRALHLRVVEVVARNHQRRIRLRQTRLSTQIVVLRRLQVKLRNHLLGEQLLLRLIYQSSRGYIGFCHFYIGFRGLYLRTERHLVNHKQHLPFLHALTFHHAQLGQRTAYLRHDRNVLPTANSSGIGFFDSDILPRDGQQCFFRYAATRRIVLCRLTTSCQSDKRPQ